MRRPYLLYLAGVVLPAAAVVAAGAALAHGAWNGLDEASRVRVGRMALQALQQDLGASVASLVEAGPWDARAPGPDDPLGRRAAGGDTAQGLAAGPQGMEVRVALPAREGDPEGTVRFAAAPLPPSVSQTVRASGMAASLYLGGLRREATDPAPGPEALDDTVLRSLEGATEGISLPGAERPSTLVALPSGGPGSAAFSVLVAGTGDGTGPPRALLLTVSLLLAFSVLAGWILLAGNPGGAGAASVLLLSLVPALTSWAFLAHAHRLFAEAAEEADRRDLTRALAVARLRDVAADPGAVRSLSGFHAWRVEGGRVTASSLAGPADAVAALPSPPPNFTATGEVRTPEGPSTYVALRLGPGAFTVVTTPASRASVGALRRQALTAGAGLLAWLALLSALLAARRPKRLSA